MHKIKHSFEITECHALLQELLPPGGLADYLTFEVPQPTERSTLAGEQSLFPAPFADPAAGPARPTAEHLGHQTVPTQTAPLPLEQGHTEEKLENALKILCQRGGFSSAIIADDQGLALADFNSPVETDVLAAFATVLGGAIAQASHFLVQHEAINIYMDINYADKAVVRKFMISSTPFYLFIICPQDIDERNEVELSLETISRLLER